VVTGGIHCVTGGAPISFWSVSNRFIAILTGLTGVICRFEGSIAVLRKVSDKEYEQRSDRLCSWNTKGEIDRKAPLWLPAGLGCMRL
jgi:hypothetical protein